MNLQTDSPSHASPSHAWIARSANYGDDHPHLASFVKSMDGQSVDVEVTELISAEAGECAIRRFNDVENLREYLCETGGRSWKVRTLSINRLSGDLVRLLGAKFDMDYETWTSRTHSSDREYFAAPLNQRGPTHFSHFNLACVDFFCSTPKTPVDYLQNRKLSRTARLLKFLDMRIDKSAAQRVYMIRRVSGHLRLDDGQWTFLFFCDPSLGFEKSGLVQDTPGGSISPLSRWLSEAMGSSSPRDYLQRLEKDGYGLVVKILRDIKSSWKLLLSEMEEFLEDLNEAFNEDHFIEAAPYLHRQFLIYIDFFQRQLFYHQRYVSYLITHVADVSRSIHPTQFKADISQENDALKVLNLRLGAIRERTTTVLDLILNLTSIKQARLAGEILILQRQDADRSFLQGESLKKLTLLNMVYLPPSFIATVYGMNTRATERTQIWTFVILAIFFTAVTMSLATLGFGSNKNINGNSEGRSKRESEGSQKAWNLPQSFRRGKRNGLLV